MTIKCFNQVILGFGMYFPPVNALSKKKCTVCCGIMNLHKLKVICYSDCMIDLNEHLAYFPEGKAGGNLVKLNWIKYFWKVCQMDVSSKRMYRGFTSKLSIFKICIYLLWNNLWRCCRKFLFKKTWADSNRDGNSRKMRGVSAL